MSEIMEYQNAIKETEKEITILQKEWHTCDRCGKEIIRYDEKYAYIKTREIKPLHEKSICTAEDLAKEAFPMAIWRDDMQYDLCPKCRKDFKRFMKNGA